jgi:hypothetical protein
MNIRNYTTLNQLVATALVASTVCVGSLVSGGCRKDTNVSPDYADENTSYLRKTKSDDIALAVVKALKERDEKKFLSFLSDQYKSFVSYNMKKPLKDMKTYDEIGEGDTQLIIPGDIGDIRLLDSKISPDKEIYVVEILDSSHRNIDEAERYDNIYVVHISDNKIQKIDSMMRYYWNSHQDKFLE